MEDDVECGMISVLLNTHTNEVDICVGTGQTIPLHFFRTVGVGRRIVIGLEMQHDGRIIFQGIRSCELSHVFMAAGCDYCSEAKEYSD